MRSLMILPLFLLTIAVPSLAQVCGDDETIGLYGTREATRHME